MTPLALVQEDEPNDEIARLRAQRDALQVDLENAEVELRVARRKIKKLEAELVNQRREDPLSEQCDEVFEHWRTVVCNGSSRVVFSEDRRKMVLARIKELVGGDMTPAEAAGHLKDAVDGAGVNPDMRDGHVYDDLTNICKGGASVARHVQKLRVFREKAQHLGPRELIAACERSSGFGVIEYGEDRLLGGCPACGKGDPFFRPLTIFIGRVLSMSCSDCGADESRVRKALGGVR